MNEINRNRIGTDASGTTKVGNGVGIVLGQQSNNTIIGRPVTVDKTGSIVGPPGPGNVISGNKSHGIQILQSATNKIHGNFIGVQANGTQALPNDGNGIEIANSADNEVGGAIDRRNVVAKNGQNGILVVGPLSKGNTITDNRIGRDNAGAKMPNTKEPVKFIDADPMMNRVDRNEIAFSGSPGVNVLAGLGITISQNSIVGDAGLPIDLNGDGPTPNDYGNPGQGIFPDADVGPNMLQNYPDLTSALVAAGQTTVQGTLSSTPNTTFVLEFFGNSVVNGASAQGEMFLGDTVVTTNASGYISFVVTVNKAFGNFVTATATDPAGNTSELSPAVYMDLAEPGNLLAAGPDAGKQPLVKIFYADTGLERLRFLAYEASFSGGVRVGMGDVNGDGFPDLITAPGAGRAAEVKIFSGTNGSLIRTHSPFAGFSGGAYVAAGDLNFDGYADVLIGSGAGLNGSLIVYSGANGAELGSGAPYEATFTGGIRVALGDVTGDGYADVITAPGAGRLAEVRVFNGQTGVYVRSHFPYFDFTGGAFVAAGDTTLDGFTEILTGPDSGYAPLIVLYDGNSGSTLGAGLAYDPAFSGSVRVAIGDANGDGVPDLVTGPGAGLGPEVKAFSGVTGVLLSSFLAYEPGFTGGIFVAASSTTGGGNGGEGALQGAGAATAGGDQGPRETDRVFSRLTVPTVAPVPPLSSPFIIDGLTLADLAQLYRLNPRAPLRWRTR